MKLSLNHVKYQKGLILERIEKNDGVVKKTLQDLGGIIDGSFTFGTGITAMLPAVKQLMAGIDPTLTEQDIILLYITAMWILVGKHQDKIEKLKKHNLNKNLVIYSNDNELMEYEFLTIYENEGQVEIHITEGDKL